jgi:hypothetical protein
VGSYGKVTGAPHLLVVIADDGAHSQQHAGYTGEGCVLAATAAGLQTCWVGGFFDPAKVHSFVELADTERAVAVSPLGHAVTRPSRNERMLVGVGRSHTRKPLETIAPGLDATWPTWAREAVACARLAPSAVNRQPWRFRLEAGALTVERSPGPELPSVTKALDCGIAMLHAELGALHAGVTGRWHDRSEGPALARFDPDTEELS